MPARGWTRTRHSPSSWAGRVRKLLEDALQSAITGQQQPKAALAGAQAQADRVLKPY